MSPKPRTAGYKDSVTAELALRAHFYIADEYPKDTTLAQLGQKMFLQLQHPTGASFTGEYYEACKRFADKNPEEMKCNDTSLDSLLRSQPSSYWSGEKLWRRAQDIKRELLNEFHSLFCQEVNKQWPILPSGKTMEDLMQELRQKLYAKKNQELKDGRIDRIQKKVLQSTRILEETQKSTGLISEKSQVAQKALDAALTDLEHARNEELSDFDDAWYPTLWRAYRAFGPSEEQPHGHGGFLSPHNGTYLSNGPMPPETGFSSPPPGGSGGRAATRKRALAIISPSPPNTPSSSAGAESISSATMDQNLAMICQRQRKANSANSCTRFIRRPLRTPEKAEVAKVLVPEQHSHLFTIQLLSICNKRCNVE